MIVPSRLTLARQLRGLTGKDLAASVDVTAGRISQLERGRGSEPSEQLVKALAMRLSVPVSFLTDGEEVDFMNAPTYAYRHRSRTPAWLRNKVEANAVLFTQFVNSLGKYFASMPASSVPKMPRGARSHADALSFAERAGQRLRHEWGLGNGPIPNVVALLESKGLWVHILQPETDDIDAFSYWDHSGYAHIVLNSAVTDVARQRLNSVHELGHLVMHEGIVPEGREIEKEAFRFGGAFLMPAQSWRLEAPRSTKWRDYVGIAQRWGVSIAAAMHRSKDLGLLTEQRYRSARVMYSQDGVRHREQQERGPYPQELPRRLEAYLGALRQAGIAPDDLASELHLPSDVMGPLLGPALSTGHSNVIQFTKARA